MSRRGPERNQHHALWPRRVYQDGDYLEEARERIIYKNFRVVAHYALHKEMQPPPVLEVVEAAELLDHFDHERPAKGIESFECAEDWFAVQAIQAYGEQQDKMFSLANHFARQLEHIRADYGN